MFGLVPFDFKNNAPVSRTSDFGRMFDLLNEPFFGDFFGSMGSGAGSFKVDVRETKDGYELVADLPGMQKEDIHLSYENNYLTISAEKNETKEEKDEDKYIRRERHYGSMSRSFHIDGIDEKNVAAEFKDGVLKVALPKKEVTAPELKEIPIK